ncbi:MAG: DUF1868 domain-containing protein [Roseicyclus sp.]|nr:DUF1868 domain-containing protein [Roseicyclus sp.]
MPFRTDLSQFAASSHSGPPVKLGTRYDAAGFLPEAGNTIVCHLDESAPAHSAVLEARVRMQRLVGAEHLLFTPPASLHMTLFEGVIETHRTADAWPDDVDCDASISQVTDVMVQRLAGLVPPAGFAVRVVGLRPTGLVLCGASEADDVAMGAWREALSQAFGFRHTEHDSYQFHMTFAYLINWLPDAVLPRWESELPAIFDDLVRAAPVIPLRPPAFCRFDDMTEFRELVVLAA